MLSAPPVWILLQLQEDGLAVVEIVLADQGHNVILPKCFTFRSESQRQILIGKRAVLSNVVFLDAIDFGGENEERIAASKDGPRIGLLKIDAHLIVTVHKTLAALGRAVFHNRGVFDVLDIGGSALRNHL